MTREELSTEKVIKKVEEYRGNLSMVARHFKISRQTLYTYIKSKPTVQAAVDEARESMLDNVESVLYSAALSGKAWAVCFFLKTQGKKRGYVELQEYSGPDGQAIPIQRVEVVLPPENDDGGNDASDRDDDA